ncbi:FAD binding domain-containing protein [Colletotrichum karsti]|uniref:FAD binding domain-containing protein n=1 Tax=Colletotrichum karsti TaxID=1095194 RepID=A0A9P6IAG3_9PEZI|nr:FAD binding domain-containing protein [Colletotrichum karsti]KAF9878171.1 FAD binding domain-containing protein [Colletotrichum karsti]
MTLILAGVLAALLAQVPASLAAGCQEACAQLRTEFDTSVHLGGNDPDFAIWDMKQQEAKPACRFEPAAATQVSRAVEVAVAHWCRFAIKGGGHMTNPDASNSRGGITVDLHRMNHVEIAEDRSRADLGPGHVLRNAYRALEVYNLTMVGGRTADVGLPGFTIGGGLSNLSPQYGLALDNVYEYQLVLPNATIVNVSETAHPDLYFALRGGGNNFGIVTNFRVRLVRQGQMLGGSRTYSINFTDQLVEQSHQLATAKAEDTYMSFWSRYFYEPARDRFRMSFSQAYYEPVLEPAVFEEVNKIPFEEGNLRIDWMSNHSLDSVSPHGFRRVYASITYRPSQTLHKKIINIFSEEVGEIKTTPGLSTSVVVQTLHHNAIKAMKTRGGNALGVESDGPLMIALLTLGWSNAEDDAAMYSYADRWVDRCASEANALGLLHPWVYINYANHNQDPFAGYGEANRLRLRRIQEAIDPRGVFTSQGLVRGSFKLR